MDIDHSIYHFIYRGIVVAAMGEFLKGGVYMLPVKLLGIQVYPSGPEIIQKLKTYGIILNRE
ncbi:MAG: hypothetical protein Ct9H90mP4_07960 [Gammaproteobacteria bacterium]|nr:MAG: hypothetical protein Ct9H90mP4_07960 [Gammaproteobacteria bacterium]